MFQDVKKFMQDLPFFKGLPQADMDILRESLTIKEYPKNKSLFHQGDKADRFFIIMNGWIKLYRTTNEGEEAIAALFTRGDVFGEAAIFGDGKYPFSAQVVEEARILELPAEILKSRAAGNPDIMGRVMSSMSREMHKL